jgi:hypothetical protein
MYAKNLFPLVHSFNDNWTIARECIRTAVLCVFYNFFLSLNKACHLGQSPVSGKPRTAECPCIQCSLSFYTGQTDLSTDTKEKEHHGHICLRKSAVAENGFTMNNASSILSIQCVSDCNIREAPQIEVHPNNIAWSWAYHGNSQQPPAG